ncbi:MAG: antitoxin Xre/MbcA/ParS toxin-binding domain-containing protein [Actinomycetota bacterium]
MSAPSEPTLDDVLDLLGEVYRPEGVDIGSAAPNPHLDGRVPADLLEEDDYDAVYEVVGGMAEGLTS